MSNIYIIDECQGGSMQSGELTVCGTDKVKINLHHIPSEVFVAFEDHCVIIPCNPHHSDFLEYEVQHHHEKSTLIISWRVSGVREIKWKVAY